jgi:DMSO/TMAO reductase YedYZ molybdopterin-dependent catalytic subunit
MFLALAQQAGTRRLALFLVLTLGLVGGPAVLPVSPAVAQDATPQAEDAIAVTGVVTSPGTLTLADLQAMSGHKTVEVSYTNGGAPELHTFTGVPLSHVLKTFGLPGEDTDHESRLLLYIVLSARDGYQVVVTYSEIDPYLGDEPMLLAWEQDGAPIPDGHGPVQLVVPGDLFGSRYIWGIDRIEVRSIDID